MLLRLMLAELFLEQLAQKDETVNSHLHSTPHARTVSLIVNTHSALVQSQLAGRRRKHGSVISIYSPHASGGEWFTNAQALNVRSACCAYVRFTSDLQLASSPPDVGGFIK